MRRAQHKMRTMSPQPASHLCAHSCGTVGRSSGLKMRHCEMKSVQSGETSTLFFSLRSRSLLSCPLAVSARPSARPPNG